MKPRVLAGATLLMALVIGSSVLAPDPQPVREWTEPRTGMAFVLVAPQTFQMGTPADEAGREEQERLHTVTLTRPFYIARHEVTQRQWEEVMGSNPSHFAGCARCPVERVNFYDVERFLRRMNEMAGSGFRLPTEAEWELACRAGGALPFGDHASLSSRDANIDGRYSYNAPRGTARNETTTVGYFRPNAWGLFDMSGNVWEWVQDWHCPYAEAPVTDPGGGGCDARYRVIRGGSWKFDGNSARCGLRYTHRPQDLGYSLGFRVVRDP